MTPFYKKEERERDKVRNQGKSSTVLVVSGRVSLNHNTTVKCDTAANMLCTHAIKAYKTKKRKTLVKQPQEIIVLNPKRKYIVLYIYSLAHSFLYSFNHSFIRSFLRTIVHWFNNNLKKMTGNISLK